jgi:hypothetical protein
MAKASDVRAARKILYDKDRTSKIETEMESIVILMNFDPGEAIAHDDPRVEPGAGPLWFVPATGKVSPAVLEAADRCERIASVLRKTRERLGDADFDRSDRRHLVAALRHLEKSWRKRAVSWRDPGRTEGSVAAEITQHEIASANEFKSVAEYLR